VVGGGREEDGDVRSTVRPEMEGRGKRVASLEKEMDAPCDEDVLPEWRCGACCLLEKMVLVLWDRGL